MSKILDALKCKCPNCGKGNMFNNKGNIFLFKMPRMNKHCNKCNYKFEIETGFFFGAMYVSYALTVAQMIASFVIFWYLLDLSPIYVFFIIAVIAVLTSTFNFKVSRSIWASIFYKDKKM